MPAPKLKTTTARSANMSRTRSTDTKPEMLVGKSLHRLAFRFRLHVRDLPGRPDIVLPRHRTVIQVKGCFWHGHSCPDGRLPKLNRHYWVPKLIRNRERHRSNERKLRRLGWSVHSLWICDLRGCARPAQRTSSARAAGAKTVAPGASLGYKGCVS
jgi:DNA mismatch endonuclease (patch repair protein)